MNWMNRMVSRLLLLLCGSFLLAACDSSSNVPVPSAPPLETGPAEPAMATFDVTVSNLTNAQPLSPIAVIAHWDGYSLFAVGSPASAGLEEMAEGGDNTALLAEADADGTVRMTGSGAAPIGPAGSETVTISVVQNELPGLHISVASMLVNTNDAFGSLNGLNVENMAVGDTLSRSSIAWDAGTEADTETAATIPGPAGGGEGFNAARDDQADRVAMHSGVVTFDDGMMGSDLTEQHRFDNPVAMIRIVRTN